LIDAILWDHPRAGRALHNTINHIRKNQHLLKHKGILKYTIFILHDQCVHLHLLSINSKGTERIFFSLEKCNKENFAGMNENYQDVEEIYDWQSTSAIYSDDVVHVGDGEQRDGIATLHIQLSTHHLIAFRITAPNEETHIPTININTNNDANCNFDINLRQINHEESDEFEVNPRWKYLVLSALDDPPVVELSFEYPYPYPSNKLEDCYPKSVAIEIIQFPKLWPSAEKELWKRWMQSNASERLIADLFSFNVCDFIAHQAMTYFETLDQNSKHGYSAILFKEESFGHHDHLNHPWIKQHGKICVIDDIWIAKEIIPGTPTIHIYARHAMKRNWKRYSTYKCPICLCSDSCESSIALPCDHLYCRECIDMYVKTICNDIKMHRVNPFICPITNCKANMNVLGSSCKEIKTCQVLTEVQKGCVRKWKKDIDFPSSHVLSICPRPKCKATGMRKINNHAIETIVRCENCDACFCELCVKRIYKREIGFDHRPGCDESDALKLIKRYLRANIEVQEKCHERWHWLKQYASVRETDMSLALWVKENANICPNCKNAIERSEGCFHMNCTECATHFCYECGEEIFFPFYGTHHCWERPVEEMPFDLFG
jgi:hypothetical protein